MPLNTIQVYFFQGNFNLFFPRVFKCIFYQGYSSVLRGLWGRVRKAATAPQRPLPSITSSYTRPPNCSEEKIFRWSFLMAFHWYLVGVFLHIFLPSFLANLFPRRRKIHFNMLLRSSVMEDHLQWERGAKRVFVNRMVVDMRPVWQNADQCW